MQLCKGISRSRPRMVADDQSLLDYRRLILTDIVIFTDVF